MVTVGNSMLYGLYSGWTGFGNMGDEAMAIVAQRLFPTISWALIYNHPLRSLQKFIASVTPHNVCGLYGGGTLINRNAGGIIRYRTLIECLSHAVPVFGSGVASPIFWQGRNQWHDYRKEWVQLLAEQELVGVRGPLSKDLLDDAGARNVQWVGDPAIVFAEEKDITRTTTGTIAINAGMSAGNIWGTESNLEKHIMRLVSTLATRGNHIKLISVWPEDTSMLERIAIATSVSAPIYCGTPEVYLEQMLDVDLLVGVKLHAQIMAAAANVPMLCLEYRPKCRDFAQSIDWSDYTIRTDQLDDIDIVAICIAMHSNIYKLREVLQNSVLSLKDRFIDYSSYLRQKLTETFA